MKKFIQCTSLLAFLLIITASCKQDNLTTVPDITLKISDISTTDTSSLLKIEPDRDDVPYYFSVITSEEFEEIGISGIQGKDMEVFTKEAEAESISLDKIIESHLRYGVSEIEVNDLTPETEYMAYGYALQPDGVAGENITTFEFKTLETPPFIIKETGIDDTSFSVKIIPANDSMIYYAHMLTEEEYEKYGASDEGISDFFYEAMALTAASRGITVPELVQQIKSQGEKEETRKGLYPNTVYYFWVLEMDTEGNIVSDIVVKEIRTAEKQMNDLSVEINFDKITGSSVEVSYTPSSDEIPYYSAFMPKAQFDRYGDNDEERTRNIIYEMMEYFEFYPDVYFHKGHFSQLQKKLKPGTEYIAIAFSVKETYASSSLSYKNITMPTGGDPSSLKGEIEITELNSIDFTLNYIPSDKAIAYVCNYISESEFKELGGNKDAIQKSFDNYIQSTLDKYPNETKEKVLSRIRYYGDMSLKYKMLTPETKYFGWFAACDENGTLQSEPVMKEVVTKEYITSDAIAIPVVTKYWDVETLAEWNPSYAKYGEVLVKLDTVKRENAVKWYTEFYKDDITDTNTYPDYLVAANLLVNGDVNKGGSNMITFYPMDYLPEVTLCAVGVDENGVCGPVYREVFRFTKEGASPIEEFPYYNDDTSSYLNKEGYEYIKNTGNEINTFTLPEKIKPN